MKTTLVIALTTLLSFPPLRAEEPPKTKSDYQNVNVEQFEKLRSDKANVVLDVRTKDEFDAGQIPGAIHVDILAPDFSDKMAKLDKAKTYLVHCAAGGRSVTACKKLAPDGFQHLVNLEGGYTAWEKAGNKGEK